MPKLSDYKITEEILSQDDVNALLAGVNPEHPPKPELTIDGTWCNDICPYLVAPVEKYSTLYFCTLISAELSYYDGPVAMCETSAYQTHREPSPTNPKIKEIFDDCQVYIDDLNPQATYREIEFFAEQIIKECCKALHPELRDMISRGQATDIIKKHFGVEK